MLYEVITDPMLSASLSGLRLGRLGLILGVTAKVPIVDTADFGTGAWDVGASLSSSVLLGYHVLVGVDLAGARDVQAVPERGQEVIRHNFV